MDQYLHLEATIQKQCGERTICIKNLEKILYLALVILVSCFFDPRKFSISYLALGITLVHKMTLYWLLHLIYINFHVRDKFYPCGENHAQEKIKTQG